MKTHSDELTQMGRLLSHKCIVFKSLVLNVNVIEYLMSSLVQMVRTSELKFGTQLLYCMFGSFSARFFYVPNMTRVKLSLLVDPLMANPINRGVDQRQKVSFEAFLTINIVIEIHYSLNEDHIIFTPCVIYLRAKHDYTCSYLRFRVLI